MNSIVDFDSDNNKGRLQIWGSTYQMSTDHFWMGVGAGNWKIAVIPYYSEKYGETYENWRRPHNDFLWILSEKGIFALISYLILFVLIVYYVFKTLFSETSSDNKLFSRLMLAGIGGYFVIAFFSFPIERVNHQIFLAIMMSGIVSIYYKSIVASAKHEFASLTLIKISVPIILLAFSIYYAFTFYKSEVYLKKYSDERQRKTPNWNQLSAYADQAFSIFTTLDLKQTPIHIYKGVSKLKLKNMQGALNDFEEAYQYHPYSPAVINNLGYAYTQVGEYKKAISLFKESLDIFPKNEDVLINLTNVYYFDKNYAEAYNTLLLCDPESNNPKIPSLKKAIESKLKAGY
jgi:tetratricopeptide (TPR) repeat protein